MKITKKRFNEITKAALEEAAIKIIQEEGAPDRGEHTYGSPSPQLTADDTADEQATKTMREEQERWATTQLNHVFVTLFPGANKPWITSFVDSTLSSFMSSAAENLGPV